MLGGKWRIQVLLGLKEDRLRFETLRRSLPGLSQKVLTQQLRHLEDRGLVLRRVIAEHPVPHVEYDLTDEGRSAQSLLWRLHEWGREHLSP